MTNKEALVVAKKKFSRKYLRWDNHCDICGVGIGRFEDQLVISVSLLGEGAAYIPFYQDGFIVVPKVTGRAYAASSTSQ